MEHEWRKSFRLESKFRNKIPTIFFFEDNWKLNCRIIENWAKVSLYIKKKNGCNDKERQIVAG